MQTTKFCKENKQNQICIFAKEILWIILHNKSCMRGRLVVKSYIILTTFLIFILLYFSNFRNYNDWNFHSYKKKILKFSSQHRINVKSTVKIILTSHVSNELAENGRKWNIGPVEKNIWDNWKLNWCSIKHVYV